jgi:hypothetical protein
MPKQNICMTGLVTFWVPYDASALEENNINNKRDTGANKER